MTSYNEAIKQIRTAVYGEEVRGSIIDALSFANETSAMLTNFIGSPNIAKNIFSSSNWRLYNGITMANRGDRYLSFNGTKGGSAQTFLLNLNETLTTDAAGANIILGRIRLRSVGHDTRISFRDDAFFNTSCVIASNSETVGSYQIVDTLKADVWHTIWVVCGGVERNITRLGVQPLDYSENFEIQVQSVEAYRNYDTANASVSALINTNDSQIIS